MSTQLLKSSARHCGKRLRLGMFGLDDPQGGVCRYLLSILKHIDREQFEVVLFERADGPYTNVPGVTQVFLDEGLSAEGPEIGESVGPSERRVSLRDAWRRFVPRSCREWAGFARGVKRFRRLFRLHPVDLLYSPIVSCEPSLVAARLAGVRCVTGTFHTDSIHGRWHERPLEIGTNHALDVGIAVSEAIRRDWITRTRMAPSRVVTIHNGIDSAHFRRTSSREDARRQLGVPIDRQVIAAMGCLRALKGFAYLIESLPLLHSEFPKAMVVIAGEGPLRAELEAKAQALGIADSVVFLGFCANANLVYEAADVFVLSSLSESLGYVLLEAMSHELPAVATRVGGVPEVVVPNETGFLIPPRDAGALATALRPLLSSAELRKSMGMAARERIVRHFNESDMVRKTLRVYQDLLTNAWSKS